MRRVEHMFYTTHRFVRALATMSSSTTLTPEDIAETEVYARWASEHPKDAWWEQHCYYWNSASLMTVLSWLKDRGMNVPSCDPERYPSWMSAQAFLLWLLSATQPAP